jgi:hypothetical protein
MQVSDDGGFPLWEAVPDLRQLRQKRQGGRIVAKEKDAAVGFERNERGLDFGENSLSLCPPDGRFLR